MSETGIPAEAAGFSQDQLERGAAALFPSVEAFGLKVNPKDLDLMT